MSGRSWELQKTVLVAQPYLLLLGRAGLLLAALKQIVSDASVQL